MTLKLECGGGGTVKLFYSIEIVIVCSSFHWNFYLKHIQICQKVILKNVSSHFSGKQDHISLISHAKLLKTEPVISFKCFPLKILREYLVQITFVFLLKMGENMKQIWLQVIRPGRSTQRQIESKHF